MEENKNATAQEQKPIFIQRTFDLPLATVWKAWSEAESFKKWWGPKDYTCPSCTIDFRVGGKYLASMKGPDGKEIWSTGTYKEIVPQKKIVSTDNFSDSQGNIISGAEVGMPGDWAAELLVTVQMEAVDGKTNLTLKHEGIPAAMHDDCVEGWNSSLDKIEENFA